MTDTGIRQGGANHHLLSEKCLSFAKAARRLPKVRGQKHPAPSTLCRWATQGRRSRDGPIAYLEAIRIGGTNCTSMEALERFFSRLSGQEAASVETPAKPNAVPTAWDKSVEKRVQQANEILRQRGIIK